MKSGTNLWVAVVAILAWPAAWSAAQDLTPVTPPDGPTTRPAGADEPAVKDAAKDTEDVQKILEGLTPEQIEQIIKLAVDQRLKVERDQVRAEISNNLLYDTDAVKAAEALLAKPPTGAQKDNIDTICRAYAKVSADFGKAYALFEQKQYKEAAEAFKKQLNAQESTYLSATQHYLYAESLSKAGSVWDAVEAYGVVMSEMPERISLAAASAASQADLFEKMGRRYYALDTYVKCLKNYGLTLSKEEYDDLFKKVEALQKIYKDPLASASGMMGDVQKRLESVDSGKETQAKEREIVALLEDLIKTAEEQQKAQSQSQSSSRKKGQGQSGKTGEGQGQGQAQGGKSGQPQGTQKPSSPAMRSALVLGAVERPSKLSRTNDGSENPDWVDMPPRERERLQAVGKKLMSERYQEAISEYRTRLAKTHQTTGNER
jgi:tetratricopeptide (TPR) repeat protein